MTEDSSPKISNVDNIYPVFSRMRGRAEHEKILGQTGIVVWLYGLSGSGKSSLAIAVARSLADLGRCVQVLDGDNIRSGLNSDLGFSAEDRKENIRRVAEVAKLFMNTGVITLVSLITPTEELRKMAGRIIGEEDFLDVYVKCPFDKCRERDVKGLYARAAKGGVKEFTGKDAPFEEPATPTLVIDTTDHSIDESREELRKFLDDRVSTSES